MARRKPSKKKSPKRAKRPAPRHPAAASRRQPTFKLEPMFKNFSATALVNDLLQGNFKNLAKEAKRFENQMQDQIAGLRVMADRKTQEVRDQLLVVRRDVTDRLRQAARKDLKKVQGRIRELAVRVGHLETLLEERE